MQESTTASTRFFTLHFSRFTLLVPFASIRDAEHHIGVGDLAGGAVDDAHAVAAVGVPSEGDAAVGDGVAGHRLIP